VPESLPARYRHVGAAPSGGDLALRRGGSPAPFLRRQLPRYIIHAANATSTEPVSVTDHSIASRPKKRLAPIPFSPCVFTPS
jgi:hypothetical protein